MNRTGVVDAPEVPAELGALPAEVPALPFPDNPDPTLCGIPELWTKDTPAWITGYYQGVLVQPVVYLYDSHERKKIIGQIPHGRSIRIELSQANPQLNYYRVRSRDLDSVQQGWVPAPFVTFERPAGSAP